MINFVEKIRQDRNLIRADNQVRVLYDNICDALVDSPTADTYQFSLRIDLVNPDLAPDIIQKVKEKFLEDDVVVDLEWDSKSLMAKIGVSTLSTPRHRRRQRNSFLLVPCSWKICQ